MSELLSLYRQHWADAHQAWERMRMAMSAMIRTAGEAGDQATMEKLIHIKDSWQFSHVPRHFKPPEPKTALEQAWGPTLWEQEAGK